MKIESSVDQATILGRIRHLLSASTTWFAAMALGTMALVAFFDVVLRLLGKPITGAYEATAILVALLVYGGLPTASARDQHVRAGLFGAWLEKRPGLLQVMGWLRHGCTASVLATLSWALFAYGQKVGEAGDKAPYIELPLSWVAGFGAFMLLLSALFALKARGGTGDERI
jgi:TRAP-type transport system small permease protein